MSCRKVSHRKIRFGSFYNYVFLVGTIVVVSVWMELIVVHREMIGEQEGPVYSPKHLPGGTEKGHRYRLDIKSNISLLSEKPKINWRELIREASFHTETDSSILRRHPRRIPGFLPNDKTRTLFGFVMRDLARRICSRQVTSSHILVVSDDASRVAGKIAAKAALKGEDMEDACAALEYNVGSCLLLYAARQGHNVTGIPSCHGKRCDPNHAGSAIPSWTLLYMIDSLNSDQIVKDSSDLLKNSTVTYIVAAIGSDGNGNVYGQEATNILRSMKFKPQLLSLSQASNVPIRKHANPIRNEVVFRPNQVLDGNFFRAIQRMNVPVRGYLFATQGLDLAIPTARQYIKKVDARSSQILYETRCAAETGKHLVEVAFVNSSTNEFLARCRKDNATFRKGDSRIQHVWQSNKNGLSESLCVRASCKDGVQSACASRVIPKVAAKNANEKKRNPPNLLLLMIDPISRERFRRSLPKTNYFIELADFTSFDQYAAVGNNSGPNQAALYTGYPLKSRESISSQSRENKWIWDDLKDQGYVTLKSEDGCIENSNMIQSIMPNTTHGHDLNELMCFDYARPNCVGSASAASHALNYTREFIRTYQESSTPWAAFVHFIDSHEDSMTLETTLDDLLWQFFLSLSGDGYVSKDGSHGSFNNAWEDTMVILMSDHGLHYGSYLLSSEGLRERSQPMLHVHLPSKRFSGETKHNLRMNAQHSVVTPFDVHNTILHTLLGDDHVQNREDRFGKNILAPFPDSRGNCTTTPGVPTYICDILSGDSPKQRVLSKPPSPMSFYADIPKGQKKTLSHCAQGSSIEVVEGCICSTNSQAWYNCSTKPWSKDDRNVSDTFQLIQCGNERDFGIEVLPDPSVLKRAKAQRAKTEEVGFEPPNILFIEVDSVSIEYADRHFPRTRELLETMRVKQVGEGYKCRDGLCSASFPLTSVTGPNSIPNQVAAFSGCLVASGPERCTTANQNGTLVCKEKDHMASGLGLLSKTTTQQVWCPKEMTKKSPWIFDIARDAGYATLFAEEFCFEDSPWVTQNNLFKLNADILPHEFFCRVGEGSALVRGEDIQGKDRFTLGDNNILNPCIVDSGTFPRAQVALQHIQSMWDSYADTPKFAFFNAMAAHAYTPFDKFAAAAEAYDNLLHSFLTEMLARKDSQNTVIVVRSDHGLQGGENIVDYSIQAEALHPWTEIIVPERLSKLSKETLFKNQERLITGADVYKSLVENVMFSKIDVRAKAPSWSYDLFSQLIPDNRKCSDAMVHPDYCLFEDERTTTTPNLGTCNHENPRQKIFCPSSFLRNRIQGIASDIGQSYVANEIQRAMCPSEYKSEELVIETHPDSTLHQRWQDIDKIVDTFPNTKVSGGIFLYPRQTALLTTLVRMLSKVQHKESGRTFNVCETGFGSGHSAAMFLEASPYTHVHTFDKFDRKYQIPVVQHLQENFPDRVSHYPGNSCQTVPRVLSLAADTKGVQCDFLHGSSLCPTDNLDLVAHAPKGVLLTSTAMHSLWDTDGVYFGTHKEKEGQWSTLVQRGCIRNIMCFQENGTVAERDFIFQKSGGIVKHSFCTGITTGLCQKVGNRSGKSSVTERLVNLTHTCRYAQVDHLSKVIQTKEQSTKTAGAPDVEK